MSGIALEMPARSRIVVDLEKGTELRWPRIETDRELMAIACGRPLDEAVGLAFSRLRRVAGEKLRPGLAGRH